MVVIRKAAAVKKRINRARKMVEGIGRMGTWIAGAARAER